MIKNNMGVNLMRHTIKGKQNNFRSTKKEVFYKYNIKKPKQKVIKMNK